MIGKTGNNCRGDVRPSFYIYIWVGSGRAMPQGMWTKCRSFRFVPRVFQAMLEIALHLLLLGNHQGVEVPMNISTEGKIHLFFHLWNFVSSLRLRAVPWRTWLVCKDKLRRWTPRKSHASVTSACQCSQQTCPVTFPLTGDIPGQAELSLQVLLPTTRPRYPVHTFRTSSHKRSLQRWEYVLQFPTTKPVKIYILTKLSFIWRSVYQFGNI